MKKKEERGQIGRTFRHLPSINAALPRRSAKIAEAINGNAS